MKRLPDGVFRTPGTTGAFVRAPAGHRVTRAIVLAYPAPAVEFPPAVGLTRSHPVVRVVDATSYIDEAGAIHTEAIMGEIDLTDLHDQQIHGFRLPEGCVGIAIKDGSGAGTTAITRGRVIWLDDEDA